MCDSAGADRQGAGDCVTPDVIFTSYGDMLRVPGSTVDLFNVRAKGGDVRVVYSPLEAVKLARKTLTNRLSFLRSDLKPLRRRM